MTALAERNSWMCADPETPCTLGDDEPKLIRTLRGHRGGQDD